MKNHIIALMEAVRLARLELECHRDSSCKASAEWRIGRLRQILESNDVNEAMAAIVPDEASPSIVPEQPVNLKVPHPWRSH